MAMSEGLRNILNIIAELSGRTVGTSVRDIAVIQRSGLPGEASLASNIFCPYSSSNFFRCCSICS